MRFDDYNHLVRQRGTRWAAGTFFVLITFVLWAMFHRPETSLVRERSQLLVREGKLCPTNSLIPFSGWMVEHYPDGAVQSRSLIQKGLLTGISQGFYTNGQIQVEEHFLAGISHGLRTKWYSDGKKMSEVMIAHGKLQGSFRRWHENGILAEDITLENGEPNGVSMSYFPSGYAKAEARHDRGKVVETKSWKDGEGQRLASLTGSRL